MNGGYKIIDFKGRDLANGFTDLFIYKELTTTKKVVLGTGLFMSGGILKDEYFSVIKTGQNYVLKNGLLIITITNSGDIVGQINSNGVITLTPATIIDYVQSNNIECPIILSEVQKDKITEVGVISPYHDDDISIDGTTTITSLDYFDEITSIRYHSQLKLMVVIGRNDKA